MPAPIAEGPNGKAPVEGGETHVGDVAAEERRGSLCPPPPPPPATLAPAPTTEECWGAGKPAPRRDENEVGVEPLPSSAPEPMPTEAPASLFVGGCLSRVSAADVSLPTSALSSEKRRSSSAAAMCARITNASASPSIVSSCAIAPRAEGLTAALPPSNRPREPLIIPEGVEGGVEVVCGRWPSATVPEATTIELLVPSAAACGE